jgi:hypothetical protein
MRGRAKRAGFAHPNSTLAGHIGPSPPSPGECEAFGRRARGEGGFASKEIVSGAHKTSAL